MASSFSGRVFAALVICLMLPAHGEVLATDQWLCDGGDVDSANVGPCFATADGPTRCSCRECDDSCGLWDNVSIFLGLEGSKQPQDFGTNANFGGRFALNWGFPLIPSYGLGAQLGTSINATGNAVQVFERIEGTTGRTQNFTTVGLFQRTDCGLHWGGGYDFLWQDSYDKFDLGQWRLHVSYMLGSADEIGVRASLASTDDQGQFGAIPVILEPITQGHVFLRHTWRSRAQTTVWFGVADGHSEANVALGDLPPKDDPFLFGADLYVPLNSKFAIFGEANFIMPSDTGTVNAYLGIEYVPFGDAWTARKTRFGPLLPVASNTSFAVNLDR